MTRSAESDPQYHKIGLIVRLRWLTFGCRILKIYVFLDQGSANTFWRDPKKIAVNPRDPKNSEASFLLNINLL